jgi:hypothetical protein
MDNNVEYLLSRIDTLEKENTSLRQLRYLSDEESITLSHRLIEKGYIIQETISSVNSSIKLHIHGISCEVPHPDFKKWKTHMNRLSKRMSHQKKIIDKKHPDISRKYRSNCYTKLDYEKFGDDVISKYFTEYPLAKWDIDTSKLNRILEALKNEANGINIICTTQ